MLQLHRQLAVHKVGKHPTRSVLGWMCHGAPGSQVDNAQHHSRQEA